MSLQEMVFVSEVGPRDGLQTQPGFVPSADKIRMIDALSRSGLPKIEATSFVHPKVVPQLSDGEQVLAGIARHPGTRYGAYVPNVRGAERALAVGVDDLKAGLTASETFNSLNVRMSTDAALQAFRDIGALAEGSPSDMVGVLGTAFGCPYEGEVPTERIMRLTESMIEAGARLIYFADTTGMGNPTTIARVVEAVTRRWPDLQFGLHLHNTRGLGLANAVAGLERGIRHFESSIGGIGGCPYAPLAVGNICTEDFVHMLQGMGYEVGVDLDLLLDAARLTEAILGRTLPGMVVKAGKASELHDPAKKRDQVSRPAATADA